MFAAESPPSEPTLVAITSWSRLPRLAIHSPMIRSDWPMFGRMYVSAVSMKLPPASTYASSTANDASRSAVQPKTFPPRQSP